MALNPEIYGHVRLTGLGGLDVNTNDRVRPIITGSGVGPEVRAEPAQMARARLFRLVVTMTGR